MELREGNLIRHHTVLKCSEVGCNYIQHVIVDNDNDEPFYCNLHKVEKLTLLDSGYAYKSGYLKFITGQDQSTKYFFVAYERYFLCYGDMNMAQIISLIDLGEYTCQRNGLEFILSAQGGQLTYECSKDSEVKEWANVLVKNHQIADNKGPNKSDFTPYEITDHIREYCQRVVKKRISDEDNFELHVCAGTWNMAECVPNDPMLEFVGQEYDIYALAVQECMEYKDIKDLYVSILGNSYYLMESRVGNVAKELGYHGFVALFLFIKDIFIQSNLIKIDEIKHSEISLGINLGFTRASNKGGVCIQFPVHYKTFGSTGDDTKFAFISTHLPSDSKGNTKWEKRDKVSKELLSKLHIDLQNTKVILLGDLNYRLNLDHVECLKILSKAMNYNNSDESEKNWTTLYLSDQLYTTLASNTALPNFVEVDKVRFPPTYRKNKGKVGECGDYTDFNVLLNAYNHEQLEKSGKIAPRTPSWTDRILFSSPFESPDCTYCIYYDACDTIISSDHHPVLSSLIVRSGRRPALPDMKRLESNILLRDISRRLRTVPFLQHMIGVDGNTVDITSDYLDLIMKNAVITKADKNIHVIVENMHQSPLLILLEGKIEIRSGDKIIEILKPGDVFGGETIAKCKVTYSAKSLEECLLFSISDSQLKIFEKVLPTLHSIFIRTINVQRFHSIRTLLAFDEIPKEMRYDPFSILTSKFKQFDLPSGCPLVLRDIPSDCAYYIITGKVKIYVNDVVGNERVISILSYGDIIDEYALEDYEEYTSLFNAMTLVPTRVYLIQRSIFQTYLESCRDTVHHGNPMRKKFLENIYLPIRDIHLHDINLHKCNSNMISVLNQLYGSSYTDAHQLLYDPEQEINAIYLIVDGSACLASNYHEVMKKNNKVHLFKAGSILNSIKEKVFAVVQCCVIKIPLSDSAILAWLLNYPYFYKNVDPNMMYQPSQSRFIMDIYIDVIKIIDINVVINKLYRVELGILNEENHLLHDTINKTKYLPTPEYFERFQCHLDQNSRKLSIIINCKDISTQLKETIGSISIDILEIVGTIQANNGSSFIYPIVFNALKQINDNNESNEETTICLYLLFSPIIGVPNILFNPDVKQESFKPMNYNKKSLTNKIQDTGKKMFNSILNYGSKFIKKLDDYKQTKEEIETEKRKRYMGGESNPIVDRNLTKEKQKDEEMIKQRRIESETKKKVLNDDSTTNQSPMANTMPNPTYPQNMNQTMQYNYMAYSMNPQYYQQYNQLYAQQMSATMSGQLPPMPQIQPGQLSASQVPNKPPPSLPNKPPPQLPLRSESQSTVPTDKPELPIKPRTLSNEKPDLPAKLRTISTDKPLPPPPIPNKPQPPPLPEKHIPTITTTENSTINAKTECDKDLSQDLIESDHVITVNEITEESVQDFTQPTDSHTELPISIDVSESRYASLDGDTNVDEVTTNDILQSEVGSHTIENPTPDECTPNNIDINDIIGSITVTESPTTPEISFSTNTSSTTNTNAGYFDFMSVIDDNTKDGTDNNQ